ncbi:transposase [Xenorhabdus beddingii]|uniref:Transposase n=1 Tax=Xenorhabdus beddingii TaxID=40578 RepID=A0A1Y2SM26_9GAMM|nr:transposase [Xenorhabdus beddingii]
MFWLKRFMPELITVEIEVVSECRVKGRTYRDSRWYVSSLLLEPETMARDQTALGSRKCVALDVKCNFSEKCIIAKKSR